MGGLNDYMDIILKQGEQRKKAIEDYWEAISDADLKCQCAFFSIKEKERKIKCVKSRKECVCSYHSHVLNGSTLASTCVDCPGYEPRHKKRARLKKDERKNKKTRKA